MEDEMRYWMNDDNGRVIAMEECPGRLWSEIDFETYDALTRPGAKRDNNMQQYIRQFYGSLLEVKMFKDGKYKLRKGGHEYEAIITTLSIYDGFYSKTSNLQFVCIPGHFPIPLDSWLLEDFVMFEAVEQSRASDGLKSPAKKQPSTAEVKPPAKKHKVTSRA